GHEFFEVYERSGRIDAYGNSEDSRVLGKGRVVRAWAISETQDRRGNFLTYTYRNDKDPAGDATVEHVPLRIDYTGHPLAPPSRAVSFVYEPKDAAAQRTLYTLGTETRSSLRLAAIDMLGPSDALVRDYRFTYGLGPATNRT